jgi:citrate synthase
MNPGNFGPPADFFPVFSRPAGKVERRVVARLEPSRPALNPNSEINAALLLDAVGIPREAFTPVFAVEGRAGGGSPTP